MAVIKDVAKLAGVSVGTVSKYLNKPENLKDATRLKVKEAIHALQYKPSPLARSMRTGKTNTIGVITPDISNPFFAEVYNSIRLASADNGYTPILYTTDDPETLQLYLADIAARQFDGLVLCFVEEDALTKNSIEELQTKIPIILLSWDINNTQFNCVGVDVYEGMLKSVNHLISLGHKRIAYAGGQVHNTISREKHNGYIKAMHTAGLEIREEFLYRGDFSLKTGYHAARKFTMCSEMPTAIVAENDILAIGSIKYCLQRKIKVPEDIAVTGFDNIPLSAMYEPSLTTVSLPITQMGTEAVRLFLQKTEKPASRNKQLILSTNLIVRSSTDKNTPVELEI